MRHTRSKTNRKEKENDRGGREKRTGAFAIWRRARAPPSRGRNWNENRRVHPRFCLLCSRQWGLLGDDMFFFFHRFLLDALTFDLSAGYTIYVSRYLSFVSMHREFVWTRRSPTGFYLLRFKIVENGWQRKKLISVSITDIALQIVVIPEELNYRFICFLESKKRARFFHSHLVTLLTFVRLIVFITSRPAYQSTVVSFDGWSSNPLRIIINATMTGSSRNSIREKKKWKAYGASCVHE